jgi:hypothetical protein
MMLDLLVWSANPTASQNSAPLATPAIAIDLDRCI